MVRFGFVFFAGALAAGLASAAPLPIDDFSLEQSRLESTGGVAVSSEVTNNGSFIGQTGTSTRTMTVVSNGDGVPSSNLASAEVGGGVFEVASGVDVTANASLTYGSLGGIDLNDYVGFNFDGVYADHEFGYEITISDTGDGSSSFAGMFSLDTPLTSVSFADLVGDVDLSTVDSIQFALAIADGTAAALDFRISAISAAIPLPAAGFFLLTALAGLGLLGARRAHA